MIGNLSIVETVIITLYLTSAIVIGLYFSRKKDQSSLDYFLGGKNIGWIAIGLSLFATNISSEHFIGLAGSGASKGMAVAQFEWIAIISLVMLGWIFVPLYSKANVFTTPEFLEKRFNRKIRLYFTGISIFTYIITKISVTLFAGSLLFRELFGIDIFISTILMIIFTGTYTIIGGIRPVIYTHIFQAIILIIGASILTVLGLNEVGGFSALKSKLSPEYFHLLRPASDPDFPWTGIIFGAPILAVWYWCTDQYIVQRVLCAKDVNNARKGTLLASFLKILPAFILVLPGLIAVVLFPEIKGDEAYPVLISASFIPAWIRGIIIAALLSALMSSLASCFNSTATLYTLDIYKNFHPEASDRKLVLVGRLTTTIITVAALFWVPLIKFMSSNIYIYLQSVQAYISPPIVSVFLFGIFWKRINSKGAIWALTVGGILGISRLLLDLLSNYGFSFNNFAGQFLAINYLHFAIMLFIISSIVLINVSLFTERKKQYDSSIISDELELEFSRQQVTKPLRADIFLSVFVLAIVLGLWSMFL